jgi:hypothetical protein
MNQASLLRESRSKHLLQSSDAAAKQFRAFKAVLPISTRTSAYADARALSAKLLPGGGFPDEVIAFSRPHSCATSLR